MAIGKSRGNALGEVKKMTVLPITQDAGYKGCGKAWAAIVEGRVVALRYMERSTILRLKADVPADAPLAESNFEFIDNWGGRSFTDYRAAAKAELALLGTVKSGMCSCFEFCF